jgi:hypothetical protein
MLDTHLRRAATLLLESAIRIAPPGAGDWGQAMLGELNQVEGSWAALMWALGGAGVLTKHALASLFIPSRHRQGIPPHGELFAQEVSMRKATLVTGGGCVVAVLLFFAAPAFRQAFRVSLAPWYLVFHVSSGNGQASLEALARRAERQRDPEGLAFCAVRLWDGRESARLAEEAVRLDPNLLWVYAVVAVRQPYLPEIEQWLPKLERWDPQNALLDLIAAESIDITYADRASQWPRPKEEEDPAWQSAMAAAFQSTKFDDYRDRLENLDRKVVPRYGFYNPYVVLSGDERGIPSYAYSDSQRFAKSLLQSGEDREAGGDRKGARERYWAVARYGQVIESVGHTDFERSMGADLQAGAYKRLQALSEKEASAAEAALFGYLAGRFDRASGEWRGALRRRLYGEVVSRWNASVVQVSGLMMIVFSGLVVMGALALITLLRGTRPGVARAKRVAAVVGFTGATGLLLSSAALYVTYRPYWVIFQRAILTGDRSQADDLASFFEHTQLLFGFHLIFQRAYFPFYLWTGVTLLGVIGLLLLVMRHAVVLCRALKVLSWFVMK